MHAKFRNVATHEFQVLSVMPVFGLESFVTMVLVLVREDIYIFWEEGLI